MILTVPSGTSSGAKLRLRGKGVKNHKTGDRGDQFVVLKIAVPKDMSDESKTLYEKLAELNPKNPREGLWM